MVETSILFKEKNFPGWISGHRIFKSVNKINKIFPTIGLSNCEKEVYIDNKVNTTASAKYLISYIRSILDQRKVELKDYARKHPRMGKARVKILYNCIVLISSLTSKMGARTCKNIITTINDRVTLNLAEDILDDDKKPLFKKGEGLFRVYNKLNELLREGKFLAMEKLENIAAFKSFSTNNVPNKKFLIRFSSDGSEGVWDIATMSMRGIQSCQTWTGSGNSLSVIGSMVDPFTGIMYLTSGSKYNEYGSKMMRRCVVRFVVESKTKIPYLLIEKMYPEYDRPTINKFIELLKERTDNKFAVKYGPDGCAGSYIPLSASVAKLSGTELSYRDTHLPYMEDLNKPEAEFNKQKAELLLKIQTTVQNAIQTNVKMTDFKEYENIKTVIKTFRRTTDRLRYDYGSFDSNYSHPYMGRTLGNQLGEWLICKSKEPANHWIKSSIISFLGNKDRSKETFINLLISLVNTTNRQWCRDRSISALPLLEKTHATIIANRVMPKIEALLKEEIQKYTIQKSEPLPIPDYVKLLN